MDKMKWPGLALILGAVGVVLRRWHLATAFEADTGLLVARAPANVAMLAFLALSAAVFFLLAGQTPVPEEEKGRLSRWDLVFAAGGRRDHLTVLVIAALLTLAAAPLLALEAVELIRAYRSFGGGENGALQLILAMCALFTCGSLLTSARDAYRMRGNGREKEDLLWPCGLGCVWLLEIYRSHAPDPVLWNYVPLMLAACAGVVFSLECTGLSYEKQGHPRRMLWVAAMTVVLSAVALAQGTEPAAMALLAGQLLAGLAALMVAPGNLTHPPAAERFGLRAQRMAREQGEENEMGPQAQEIQEEDTHE